MSVRNPEHNITVVGGLHKLQFFLPGRVLTSQVRLRDLGILEKEVSG